MRYIIKLLSIALSIVLIIASFIPLHVFAESTPIITGNTVDAQIGEKVEITFNISNADKVCGGNFNVVYDSEYLQVISAKAGAVFSNSTPVINTKYDSGKIRMTWAGLSPVESNGEIIRVEFLVKENVPSGILNVVIENLKLYDLNTESIASKINDAEIVVKNTYLSLKPENNGENISVSVQVSGDTIFQGGNYTLLYDNNALEPVSVGKGALLSGTTISYNLEYASNAIRVSWAGVDSVTEKGEVCKVIFKAKEGYTGNVAFEIKDVKLYDENGEALVVQTERAEFAIESIDGKIPHISIETVKYENEGFLSVSISENSLLCGGGIEVKYDNTLVDITNAEAGVVLNGKSPVINTEYGENIIKLSWASALPMTESGELMKIYFTIKEEVRGFVTFELNAQTLYNDKTENVVATYTNGGVTIDRAPIAKKGDVYTDEAINSKDAIKLAQYLARWEVELSDESKYAADVFSDELINSKDAIKLAQYLARWDVTLE